MARRLLNLLAVLSLMLCIGGGAFWLSSYKLAHSLHWADPARGAAGVVFSEGHLIVSWASRDMAEALNRRMGRIAYSNGSPTPVTQRPLPDGWPLLPWKDHGPMRRHKPSQLIITDKPGTFGRPVDRREWTKTGFIYELGLIAYSNNTATIRLHRLLIPSWFTALSLVLCAALPARHLWRCWRAHRRRRLGLCPTCGYDLRATPDRCPECGTPTRSEVPA